MKGCKGIARRGTEDPGVGGRKTVEQYMMQGMMWTLLPRYSSLEAV